MTTYYYLNNLTDLTPYYDTPKKYEYDFEILSELVKKLKEIYPLKNFLI